MTFFSGPARECGNDILRMPQKPKRIHGRLNPVSQLTSPEDVSRHWRHFIEDFSGVIHLDVQQVNESRVLEFAVLLDDRAVQQWSDHGEQLSVHGPPKSFVVIRPERDEEMAIERPTFRNDWKLVQSSKA